MIGPDTKAEKQTITGFTGTRDTDWFSSGASFSLAATFRFQVLPATGDRFSEGRYAVVSVSIFKSVVKSNSFNLV